jgi:hypothetical protein
MGILTLIGAKVWKWIIALGALLAVVGAIFLKGRSAGVKTMQPKIDAANDAAVAATVNTKALESRHETDVAVQKLPDAPPQPVATADSATAAGKLRESGWTRD